MWPIVKLSRAIEIDLNGDIGSSNSMSRAVMWHTSDEPTEHEGENEHFDTIIIFVLVKKKEATFSPPVQSHL